MRNDKPELCTSPFVRSSHTIRQLAVVTREGDDIRIDRNTMNYFISSAIMTKHSGLQVASLLLLIAVPIAAFSVLSHNKCEPLPPKEDERNEEDLSFHEIMQLAGKTVFRPGGGQAASVLYGWAGLCKGSTVLDMSASHRVGAMHLTASRSCDVLLIYPDPERLQEIERIAIEKGYAGMVRTKCMDPTEIDKELAGERFDAIVVESTFTHEPNAVKKKILQTLLRHTDQVLLHEVGLRGITEESGQADKVRRQVGRALKTAFNPLPVEGPDSWRELFEECGYKITNLETGSLRILHPRNLWQDEGPAGVAKIAFNLATKRSLRDRVLGTKAVVGQHNGSLGYIILRAIKA